MYNNHPNGKSPCRPTEMETSQESIREAQPPIVAIADHLPPAPIEAKMSATISDAEERSLRDFKVFFKKSLPQRRPPADLKEKIRRRIDLAREEMDR